MLYKYDLVYSASAFHWVPENVGYTKVFSMLKRGGAFAQFANHPYRTKDNLPLSEEIDRIFSANEYRTLRRTYSDHIAIEESIRKKFFLKIEDAINSHGGSITMYDTIDLQLARKP